MHASITVQGLDAIRRGLAQAPDVTQHELLAAMTEAVMLLESDVQKHFPKSGRGGGTSESIGGEAFIQEAGVLGVVSSPQPLVSWIEFGTRPHPVNEEGILAIADWAQAKWGLGEEAALSLAHGYAWKVRMLGTPPNPVMQQSLERNLPAIARMFDEAAGRVAVQILGAGGTA